MFSRTLTIPQALRHYADTRVKAGKSVVWELEQARYNFGTDREYHAEDAIRIATQRISLLEFLLAHAATLPTDAASIEVLRADASAMCAHIATARHLIANPWA